MNRVLLACTSDQASMNIRDRLLEISGWREVSVFDGSPVHLAGDTVLLTKRGLHLDLDDVDVAIAAHIEEHLPDHASKGNGPLDLLVFLSKHRSEMNVDSLTVHSPGNYGEALFGGRPHALPPSSPRYISAALRALYRAKKEAGLKDRTTFETTHHGPTLASPSFFIEIGSYEARWTDRSLGEVVARSLMSWDPPSEERTPPICVGIGGGHYAPRFSDLAIQGKADMGHMVPDHAIGPEAEAADLLGLAVASTPGAELVMVHRTERMAGWMPSVEKAAEALGLVTRAV